MKKITFILFVLIVYCASVYAQTEIAPDDTGVLTSQQKLKEISVSKMEDSGFWYGVMPADHGLIELKTFRGSPAGKTPIGDEEQFGLGEDDDHVVGAKVSFYHRGVVAFSVKPLRPLPIEGITKTISVWVAGRNNEHELEILISDHFGNRAVLPMGKLNFSGWKKLTVTVPPFIKQRDYHYNDVMGLTVDGFNVKCNIDETYGQYYIYIDDIRAITDLFAEESRDSDDIMDAW